MFLYGGEYSHFLQDIFVIKGEPNINREGSGTSVITPALFFCEIPPGSS